jgi:hypothetical protein
LIRRLLKKMKRKTKFVGPVQAEDIPWDVPLDQTTPKIHIQGDITSV